MGILETDGVKNPEMNEKIQKEYTRETENWNYWNFLFLFCLKWLMELVWMDQG